MIDYRLAFNGLIYEVQANALRNRIAQILERPDCNSLCILFSSDGGSTDQSISLFNFVRALHAPIEMHAVGHVGSAAIPVFLAGHKRTCVPTARFFFHVYDWGFEGRQTLDRIAEATLRLENDIKLARDIAADRTKIPHDKLKLMYRTAPTPTIYSAQEAKQFGIVDDVTLMNPTGVPEPNVAVWTVAW